MKTKWPIIAFTGLAGAGKTLAAAAFEKPEGEEVNGYEPAVRYSFAQPIKQGLHAMGVPLENLLDPAKKNEPIPSFGNRSARQLCQTLGTDWGRRMVCDDLWIRRAAVQLIHFVENDTLVVIDDLRFNNEAEVIVDLGGVVIEIVRPGLERGKHESEQGILSDFIDHKLYNSGSPADLHAAVWAYCRKEQG